MWERLFLVKLVGMRLGVLIGCFLSVLGCFGYSCRGRG